MTACYDCSNEEIEPAANELKRLVINLGPPNPSQESSRTTASTLETGQEHSYPFGLSILSESRMKMTQNRDYPLTSRNTYTPVLKRRYAHTIGFLPERDLLCVHCHAVSDQIFCAQALPTRKITNIDARSASSRRRCAYR